MAADNRVCDDCGLADSVLLYCCCTEFLIDKGFRHEE